MPLIISGHVLGISIPVFIMKNITMDAAGPAELVMIFIALAGLILFAEYQLVQSLKTGRIYFRGTIDRKDGASFTSCQVSYSILAGFFMAVFFQNL